MPWIALNPARFGKTLLPEWEGVDLTPPTVRLILLKPALVVPTAADLHSIDSVAGAYPRRGCWYRWMAATMLGCRSGGQTGAVVGLGRHHRRGDPGVFHATEDTRGYLNLLEGLGSAVGHSPSHPKRPACGLLVQCSPGASGLRVHPVSPCNAAVRHPAGLRPLPRGQGTGGADGLALDQANEVLQEFFPSFNVQCAVAAEQSEKAYQPRIEPIVTPTLCCSKI